MIIRNWNGVHLEEEEEKGKTSNFVNAGRNNWIEREKWEKN